ncbi:hypothetical protein PHAVU_004G104000 [Phaseolus vulgaris]|uniref:Uncharacterized protein n=1 Tax=Phaseolus vulgaris TaxID=3885 RepID=V7C1U5_PHAVU|nr:hypothetical protein PHAVU_004G104000g [Phaseolus vulgaris]ESW24114.1 hypothetical protein PHAVU_004G104000g [Phaseolus vulgaris]
MDKMKREHWKLAQAWERICDISKAEFEKVYQCLGVRLEAMVGLLISHILFIKSVFLSVFFLFFYSSWVLKLT